MRHHHGTRRHVFGLAAGFAAVLLAFVASSSAADYIPKGQPIPQSVKWVNATPSGVNASYTANLFGQTSRFPVPVNASTVGRLLGQGLVRGVSVAGWALALKSLLDGAGYVFNELKKEVETKAEPQEQLGPGEYVWKWQDRHFSDPQSACSIAVSFDPAWAPCTVTSVDDQYVRFQNEAGSNNAAIRVFLSEWQPDWSTGRQAMPVSMVDLGQLVKNSPQIVNAVLVDPETGAPVRIPELVDALNNLRRAYEAANGLEAGPDLAADGSYGADGTPSQDTRLELPGFCGWASVVCDFVDWVKADSGEKVELPETQVNLTPSDWTSGIGAGECPVAQSVFVDGPGATGEVTFDWGPICQGATKLRPVLLAVCVMVAGFIIAGLRKGSV